MGTFIKFDPDFFEFFIELSMNNQKTWFDINRKRYEEKVKLPFIEFVGSLIEKMANVNADFSGLIPKECIFRINKDIRFAKDKTPYKLFCSASIHVGGRKSMFPGGLYIEIGAEECAIYSGVYMPEKEDLFRYRENIAGNITEFKNAIGEHDFIQYFGSVKGERNKKIDSVFKDVILKEPLILNKQFYVMHRFEAERTFESDFIDYVVHVWKSAGNFNRILLGNRG